MPNRAYVFEHGTLAVGEAVGEHKFTSAQFDALVRYNERHGCAFFRVGHQRLHFNSFVGVLQVGTLAIEILPKAEKSSHPSRFKWQNALLQMLHQSGLLEVESAPEADLELRRSPLIDLYLATFVAEVERLAHAGLAKKYRLCQGNLNKLKGRIVFAQDIRRNLLHRERFFTAHQTYDADNVFNRILKRALAIVEHLAIRPSITARAAALMLAFERVSDVRVTAETFTRITLDRNTVRYHRALQLARLIILNYAPDLTGGSNNVIAILFDMNKLFERFILVHLLRAQSKHPRNQIRVQGQVSRRFWGYKSIRPDVLIKVQSETGVQQFILDTKWKIPSGNLPSDEDLKQIYTYNQQFTSNHGFLVYPRARSGQMELQDAFAASAWLLPGHRHTCGTHFIELFDAEGHLRKDIGTRLIDRILATAPTLPE